MPGMGLFFVGILLVGAFCVCLVPFGIVLCWPYARRRTWAWLMAALPLMLLTAGCLWEWTQIKKGERMVTAASAGDIKTVRALLENGVSPDASEIYGYTAIHGAIDGEHWDVVRLLVKSGAHDADAGDDGHYEDSVIGKLEAAGHKGWADEVRERGPL